MFFKNLNLPWKINLIVTIIIISILAVIAFVIYNYTTEIVLDQIDDKIDIMTSYQKKLVAELMTRKSKEIEEIPQNPIISLYTDFAYYQYGEYEDSNKKSDGKDYENTFGVYTFQELIYTSSLVRQTGQRLKKIIENIDYAQLAYITNHEGVVIADSRFSLNEKNSDNYYTGKSLKENQYKNINEGDLKIVEERPLLFLNTSISNEEGVIGYLVVGLSTDIFTENLDTLLGDFGTITLFNESGIILNHHERNYVGREIQDNWFLEQMKQDNKGDKVTSTNYKILEKMEDQNLFFAIDIPLSKINAPANKIKNIIFKISLIGIIIMFLIVSSTIKWQLKPIKSLLEKMNMVSEGEVNTRIEVKRNDEIGQLALNFNKMVNDIKDLLRRVKKDQEEIRKTEFKALQSQINPHFLYNTLDFIYWMTKTQKYEAIGKMAIALSRFFRLALNKGQDVTTVEKEIEHVKNYLLIQKLRYPHKFESKIEVDPEIKSYQCIKLILQPLVENSLLHGLKDIEEGGLVEIIGREKENKIIFEVCDNGCGFKIKQMQNMIKADNSEDKGYALKNVHNRIQLYYGDNYGLSFANNENGGACVKVTLPVKKEEENKDV